MRYWRYVQACSRGTSHLANDLPCQDRALSRSIIDSDGQEIFVAAVADGAGSACRSEYGAEIATKMILKFFEEFFEHGEGLADISRCIIEQWVTQISDQIAEFANDEGISRREYACTLLVAVVKPTEGLFFQIGDGAIVIGSQHYYEPVFWPMSGEYANTTYFITDADSVQKMQFEVINDKAIEDVSIMSDGLQSLALQFTTRTAHIPFFKPMFIHLAQESNPGFSKILSIALENFLNSEPVCNRTDDDKTLILSTCRYEPLLSPIQGEIDSDETV